MPRINQYTDNTTIENDDKMLTYDTHGAATKLTAFSTIWNWIINKLHALTSSSAALTPSTDRVLMDKNGTMTRVDPASVAKYGIETYNGSTIAGSAQTVKSALDTLNSNMTYKAGDSVPVETIFTGKPVNAKDGYFGAIILPKAVKSGLTITISNAAQYGYWYSDGVSHTLSLDSISNIAVKVNTLWFKIPATNISDANSLAWLRFGATITFS